MTLDHAMPVVAIGSIVAAFFGAGFALHIYEENFLKPAGWPMKDVWWGLGGFLLSVLIGGGGAFAIAAELLGIAAILITGDHTIHVYR